MLRLGYTFPETALECMSLLASDSASCPAASATNRLQAGSYTSTKPE
jgi:hypothetical protein